MKFPAGTLFSFNSYFVPLMDEYGASKSQAATVGALANGFVMVASKLRKNVRCLNVDCAIGEKTLYY